MKLTPRLQAIANLIPDHVKMGDIGSDHGYLVTYLYEEGRGVKPIASDINQGPVDNAIRTFEENNLVGKIDVRLGGGFEPYDIGEIDVAVIAGMGGILIRDIIEAAYEKASALKFMVLQPMTQQAFLRAWLLENGFEIFAEQVVREGEKFYEIFCVRRGECSVLDTLDYEIGLRQARLSFPKQDKDVFRAYLEHKIRKYDIIKTQVASKGSEESREMLLEVETKIQKLKGVLESVC